MLKGKVLLWLAVVVVASLMGLVVQQCVAQESWSVAEVSLSEWRVKIDFLLFEHEKLVMDDYYFIVEFRVPAVNNYSAQRVGPCRYLEEIPDVEFPIEESWLGLESKITITAVWHADDVIIDINPNPSDGRWTPYGKKASALVISYVIGTTRTVYADGNDDGFLTDLRNDAKIRTEITTIPELPTTFAIYAFAIATTGMIIKKKYVRQA